MNPIFGHTPYSYFMMYLHYYLSNRGIYITVLGFGGILSPQIEGFGCFAYLAFCCMPADKRISCLLCNPYEFTKF